MKNKIKLSEVRITLYEIIKNKPYLLFLTLTGKKENTNVKLREGLVKYIRKLRERKSMVQYICSFEKSDKLHIHAHILIDVNPGILWLKEEGCKILNLFKFRIYCE